MALKSLPYLLNPCITRIISCGVQLGVGGRSSFTLRNSGCFVIHFFSKINNNFDSIEKVPEEKITIEKVSR